MRVPVLLTELCHSPGDGMQHFPTVFGEAAACYARGQAYLLTFFFFSPQQQSFCIDVFLLA